jgi:hypothetical protein
VTPQRHKKILILIKLLYCPGFFDSSRKRLRFVPRRLLANKISVWGNAGPDSGSSSGTDKQCEIKVTVTAVEEFNLPGAGHNQMRVV